MSLLWRHAGGSSRGPTGSAITTAGATLLNLACVFHLLAGMASRATCIGELRLPPAVGSLPGMMVKAGPQLEVAVAVRPMTASGGTPPVPGSQDRNSHGAAAALGQAAATSPFEKDLRAYGLLTARLTMALVLVVAAAAAKSSSS